jgi:hypothetical protein
MDAAAWVERVAWGLAHVDVVVDPLGDEHEQRKNSTETAQISQIWTKIGGN